MMDRVEVAYQIQQRLFGEFPSLAWFLDEHAHFRKEISVDPELSVVIFSDGALEAYVRWAEEKGSDVAASARELRDQIRTAERALRYEKN